jgi:hypothetical protein
VAKKNDPIEGKNDSEMKNGSGSSKSNSSKSNSSKSKDGSDGSSPASSTMGSAPGPAPTADHGFTVRWRDQPQEHDYPAAASYLNLVCDPTEVQRVVAALKDAPLEHHKAKDLLRASGLELLPVENPHVAGDLAKIRRGEALSPILLMRGDFRRGAPLTIADGYHRVCASYHLDENVDIPCHLVDHRSASGGVDVGAAARAASSVLTLSPGGPVSVQ